jgi:hypothetical protein
VKGRRKMPYIDNKAWLLSGRISKDEFIREFKGFVVDWVRSNETEILQTLTEKRYSWKGESYLNSVNRRNMLEYAIRKSREANNNGVDLGTLNRITQWGFGRNFPLSDNKEALKITREVFGCVDKKDYVEAAKRLMGISGVAISRATKVIGLSDQETLCIYDSRVGNALKDLKIDGKKFIKCPPDQGFKRDFDYASKNEWALNYERLIWVVGIIKEYFLSKGIKLKASDVEIALFMMGE